MAKKRLLGFEKVLAKDQSLAENIKGQIESYHAKGYIRKLTDDELSQQIFRTWYLPIFAVKNPNKPDKTRIVWDAAANKVGNISLNTMLVKGPDQLSSFVGILMRFREGRVAICGDIQEMFPVSPSENSTL